MQNCRKCKASWNLNRVVDVCPFCGADLREEKKVSTIEEAFSLIVNQHREDVFANGQRLLGLLSDYAPQLVRERKLIKIAVESGAYKAIYEADSGIKMQILNKYVAIMKDSYFIEESWARKALLWGLGAFAPNDHDDQKRYLDAELLYKPYDTEKQENSNLFNPAEEHFNNTEFINEGLSLESMTKGVKLISSMDSIPDNCWHRDDEWSEISTIILSEGIEEIKMEAFCYMKELQKVQFPFTTLKRIGFGAFRECPKLNSVIIPDSVTTIAAHAFEKCVGLTDVKIPLSVKYIGDDAFRGCPLHQVYVGADCVVCDGNYAIKKWSCEKNF